MYTIEVRHKVENYAEWKAAFDAARDFRRQAGEIACRVYTAHGSENDVIVSLDWDSLERAREFMSSAKLIEGMAEAGVREMPHMVILEKKDEYKP